MLSSLSKNICAGLSGTALLLTSACGNDAHGQPRYCEANPSVCAAVAFLIVGGIIAAHNGGSSGSSSSGGGNGGGAGNASDMRLKTDIHPVRTLDNGLKLYAFRYVGQQDGFVGVMAEDLLQDPRYRHAVWRGEDGYLRVDYNKLPVTSTNMHAMAEASERVLALKQLQG